MPYAMLEQRVTDLESMMAQLIATVNQLSLEMREFKDEMRAFKDEMLAYREEARAEMREFKAEMRAFKDEMRAFKEEMLDFKDEMRDFKDEMRDFKDEMLAYREESRAELKEWRRQWGELANKMGTMAEDLVAPSIGRILRTTVGCPEDRVDSVAVRVRRRHPRTDKEREFDVVATCGKYLLINETKSRLDVGAIDRFVEVLPGVRDFFPEYVDKEVIGAIASLYVDEGLVRYGERQGLIVLGFGEDVMDVLNEPGFVPKSF
jgi:FtsZ-binding cell division protein ZapB